MARSGGISAAKVDFSDHEHARLWFDQYPREVCVALAVRSALRLLPLIEASRNFDNFAARDALPVVRACFLAWAIAEYPSRRDHLREAGTYAGDDVVPAADRATGEPEAPASDAAFYAVAAAYYDDPAENAAYAAADAHEAAAHDNAFLAVFQADAVAIEERRMVAEIVASPLWPGETPTGIAASWDRLRTWMLEDEANSWHPWVQWYERVRDGRPSFGEAFDLAVASLTDEQWYEEPRPAAVNRRIAALLAEHTVPVISIPPDEEPEPIPPQGPGPHVVINAAGKLDQAPPEDIDAEGNNLVLIRQLLPVQRGAVADLLAHLASTDAFSQLASVVRDYRDAIAEDETRIAWGTVFGLGVRLENAAVAAKREIDDRLAPSLEDAALEALDTVIRLHGPLILSTRDGRELSEIADDFARRPEQQAGMRQDAEALVAGFKKQPEIIEPNFKRLVEDAAETVGDGRRPERGAAYWTGLARNLATILVPAGVLGTLAWLTGGAGGATVAATSGLLLQQNARIREAATSLGTECERLADAALRTGTDQADLARAQAIARLRLLTPFRDFVIANQEPLRRIAAYSPSLRWMLWYIDFVLRTNGKQ
jgi:hypothetical protein